MSPSALATIALGLIARTAPACPDGAQVPAAYRTAAPWARGAALLGDLSEGRYAGRRLFLRQADLVVAPTDRLAFWLGESDVVAHGHASASRLRLHDDRQTVRYRLGPARGTEFAIQADRFGATDATATTDSAGTQATSVYGGTRGYEGSILATRGAFDASAAFGLVDTHASDGRTFGLSFGYRTPLGRLYFWGQGTLVGQNGRGKTELKPIIRGQLSYAPTKWGAVVLEGTAFLHGVPYNDPLGSFLLYNPGGSAAQGLRSGVIGFGTLRLTFSARF